MLDQTKLDQAQLQFLMRYPGGFSDPEMLAIGKKHRMPHMVELAQDWFSPAACSNVLATADNMVKLVGRASMVSLFEKPKFRDFINRLNQDEKAYLVNALSQLLHGNSDAIQQRGFEAFVDMLKTYKLAKWSLVSIIPNYYAPQREVFVKPTTAKNILAYFDIGDPVYKPAPSWDFYYKYRALINDAKTRVDPSLAPYNAAFTGFLMMAAKPE